LSAKRTLRAITPRSPSVEALQAEHTQRHNITVDSITEMLKADKELARSLNQSTAAVSGSMGLAKLHGLVKDKCQNELSFAGDAALIRPIINVSLARNKS
jgi:phage terminase small subunit